jgi:integrase
MVTGFRRGELCSLRWRHLELERRQMWVERSTPQTSRAGAFEKDTKTDTDRRIALDPETVQPLLEHRAPRRSACVPAPDSIQMRSCSHSRRIIRPRCSPGT